MSKTCPGCKRYLDSDSFCYNKHCRDGLDTYCRACQSAAKKARRENRIAIPLSERVVPAIKACGVCKTVKESDCFNRDYGRKDCLSARCRDCDSEKAFLYRKSESVRIKQRDAKRGDAKVSARTSFNTRVKRGKILKQPCRVCGDKEAQGHHEDYAKPYDVIWLCRKHHAQRHTEMRRGIFPSVIIPSLQ